MTYEELCEKRRIRNLENTPENLKIRLFQVNDDSPETPISFYSLQEKYSWITSDELEVIAELEIGSIVEFLNSNCVERLS